MNSIASVGGERNNCSLFRDYAVKETNSTVLYNIISLNKKKYFVSKIYF